MRSHGYDDLRTVYSNNVDCTSNNNDRSFISVVIPNVYCTAAKSVQCSFLPLICAEFDGHFDTALVDTGSV